MPSNVVFENVSCTFRHRSGQLVEALRGVSLEASEGQFICVVGRSGHGKTTLLRVLAGLQKPSGGRVAVGDQVVEGPGSDRAMVFQQDTVFPWMHVRDNVEFGLAARGLPKAERRRISDARLRDVGLEDFADLVAARALRRHAQARRPRGRPRRRIPRLADGRAVRVARLLHAPPAARHPPRGLGVREQDGVLRHPRHRGGAHPRRPRAAALTRGGSSTTSRSPCRGRATRTSARAPRR